VPFTLSIPSPIPDGLAVFGPRAFSGTVDPLCSTVPSPEGGRVVSVPRGIIGAILPESVDISDAAFSSLLYGFAGVRVHHCLDHRLG
jgi:hypothetical protein